MKRKIVFFILPIVIIIIVGFVFDSGVVNAQQPPISDQDYQFYNENVAGKVDIRDIKDPIKVFPVNWFFIIVTLLIILVLASILLLLWFYRKKRQSQDLNVLIESFVPAHEKALERLYILQNKHLLQKGMIKEYYYEISFIVRHYLEDRFQINAPDMTTEEFICYFKSQNYVSEKMNRYLVDFLRLCDLVKFAKYGPNENEKSAVFRVATDFIESTKEKEVVLEEQHNEVS